jgi:acetylornithine deacetylase
LPGARLYLSGMQPDSVTTARAIELLERLVAFDTVSRHSNLALIAIVEDFLRALGASPTRVPNDDGTKSNLFATIGPALEGGVVLSGHSDVVPIDGQDWVTDPFALTARDGRLYGRGTTDMKGFVALALAAAEHAALRPLKRPLHLAISYDEEIGCRGAPSMIEILRTALPKPAAVIVGEPTNMKVVTAQKGITVHETTVTGFEAHSSLVGVSGVSAVMVAARLIAFLDDWLDNRRAHGPHDEHFVPPHTSVHVGMIEGGTAANITAKTCRFVWDTRTLPGESAAELRAAFDAYVARDILPAMRAISPLCAVDTLRLSDTAGLTPEKDGAAEQLARALTGDNGTHAASYATEAGQFQEAGFSTVICGPGSIEQAHQPNEYIDLAEMQAGAVFMNRLLQRLCG